MLLSEFEELPNALEYEICDYMQNFSGGGSICTQLAVFNIRLKAENEITEIHTRLTSTCVKDGNEWKIASLHMSTPEHDQEKGAFFPLYYGKSVLGTLSKESEEKLNNNSRNSPLFLEISCSPVPTETTSSVRTARVASRFRSVK